MNSMTARNLTIPLLVCLPGLALGVANNQPTTQKERPANGHASVRFLNRAPAGYSHVVEVRGGRTLYIAGQVALGADGKLVGPGDLRAQTKQVFENLKARLAEGGAAFKDVVKLNYYLTDGSDLPGVREIRNSYLNTEKPPASTLVVVKRLFREDCLIEVEAVAVVDE
jgi:enamine deaminase RidA (YjgF/YER057c/UK114 family)